MHLHDSFDVEPPILKRSLPESTTDDEPEAKRQKSSEPVTTPAPSVSDKVASSAYQRLGDMITDVAAAVKASLGDLNNISSETAEGAKDRASAARIHDFNRKAMDLLRREEAYPKTSSEAITTDQSLSDQLDRARTVLSLVGYAPQERRLFTSLASPDGVDASEIALPLGLSATRVYASTPQERPPSLGELFGPPRALPSLQPPKQPKTQAKGNMLDFYHPELADVSRHRNGTFFLTKLSAGYYLDYSHASPSSSAKSRQHERAQSLAGKKPSSSEQEITEMETLFRGAFSSFAPCKDDSAALIPSNVAGRMWWQKAGRNHFQNMIEVEYVDEKEGEDAGHDQAETPSLDEKAVQEAIDNWDDAVIDPTLEDFMGSKRDNAEKETDEILDEVSDMIQTLSSYQRIRNLTLPNSQNRQTSDPVTGDMLANSGPQPSEEEQATYDMLKAQLALIIKTLPPYAVAKLNGDQLDDLLISTKVEVSTDHYRGVMEEDDAAMQARLRAQQQEQQQQHHHYQQQQQAAQKRTPSISYQNHYQPQTHQYGTPSRTPAAQTQFYQHHQGGPAQRYQQSYQQTPQQQRNFSAPSPHQARPPQPNQYPRQQNGYPTQYAAQLAKSQTPYGHQNMQYANQQRPQYGQTQQQATPQTRFQQYQPPYQHQQGTPTQVNYGAYTNGAGSQQQQQQHQQRTMSPQIQHRQAYSTSPSIPQVPRYGTPNQGMASQQKGFPANSTPAGQQFSNSSLGYHTTIPEAQQQRILEQAKARVAAQERSAMFADKITQPGVSGLAGIGLGGNVDVNRLAAARASMGSSQSPKPPTPVGGQRPGMNGTPVSAHVPPHKVTPVPVPVIPGLQQQRKPST